MDEPILKMIERIKKSSDGPEFVQYLQELSLMNYRAYKVDKTELNDVHKGYAIAIDSLIELFDNCTKILANKNKKDNITETGHY